MSDDDIPKPADESEVAEIHKRPEFQLVVDNTGRYCSHGIRLVCHWTRTVVCKTCGAQLDAFDVLNSIARERENWIYDANRLRQEIRLAQARLDELKRIERNAVSRLRRKGVKIDDYYTRTYRADTKELKRPTVERVK